MTPADKAGKPRIGFVGVGWIGQRRLEAIIEDGVGQVVGIVDSSPEMVEKALAKAPGAVAAATMGELLAMGLDGVVISTPNALHLPQCLRALEAGCAVFCQKPLARDAEETSQIVEAARQADRLLSVDLSYRHVDGVRKIRHLVNTGALGQVFACDLVFHNAYGPDKPWFYDIKQAGGGCVLDLGVHLVDLALWMLGFPEVESADSRRTAAGKLIAGREQSEDFCEAQLTLSGPVVARLACSWKLQAGCDAVIEASFFGTGGGAAVKNVNGSFLDFEAWHYSGCKSTKLSEPPDAWGGRAAVAWTRQLAESPEFDPEVEGLVTVARVLDAIYSN